jgi:hypothetical protein
VDLVEFLDGDKFRGTTPRPREEAGESTMRDFKLHYQAHVNFGGHSSKSGWDLRMQPIGRGCLLCARLWFPPGKQKTRRPEVPYCVCCLQ